MGSLKGEWNVLLADLAKFQDNHTEYVKKLDEVESLKKNYLQQFEKLKKKLYSMKADVAKQESDQKDEDIVQIQSGIDDHLNYMSQISDTFPRQNGAYLKLIIGNVSVSILNKAEKWKYKEEYERFKFFLTLLSLFYSLFLLIFRQFRVLDVILNFFLVWFYCTLTIRESILVINGSKIIGWWRIHHFIATACTAILLTWPESETYMMYRTQFMVFTFYLSFVQVLQYYYQRGCLYRLRALGEKGDMDTTTEGFQAWMFKGLYFILPFLYGGYFFQMYNAIVLYNISKLPICNEWQVFVLSVIFFILACGNIITTSMVLKKKLKEKVSDKKLRLKYLHWKNIILPSINLSNKNE